jgi:hypothetical protein
MRVGGQRHAPAALPPGKTGYRFYRRLGGTQGRSGHFAGEISLVPTGVRTSDCPSRSVVDILNNNHNNNKDKGKNPPRTGHEGPEGE